VFVTLAGQNLFVLVPDGTSTFREFSKRRNDRPLIRPPGCRGFETRHKQDESQARMGVNRFAQEI
jgi:hypothetical protein